MEDIVTALTTQFTSMGTSITDVMTKVLPIALPIIGGVFVIKKGISIFKSVTNKA